VPYSEDELGTVKEVLMARSMDAAIKEKAQYGGAVTTLLSLAMAEGLIDSAILTRTTADKTPEAFLARNTQEVLQSAGSNYMACPILETYNRLPEDNSDKLAIVGVPCQVIATTKMKREQPQHRSSTGNIKLVIGLFCTWALAPDSFHRFLKDNLNLPSVIKVDIPPPPANRFDVYTHSGKVSLPLEEVREFTMPSCAYCLDMTSEFADISVGSVEGIEGWNTVIIRTDNGAKLMEMAVKQGKLETSTLPAESLAHLKEAALIKKKRSLGEIVKMTGSKKDLLYLGLSPTLVDRLLS
ncbi:MAG: Coenzyme F420 hydrogenase/dehydrogenase, beta subunit C-terminal domain, partial [Dehalococcoidales bacterium]